MKTLIKLTLIIAILLSITTATALAARGQQDRSTFIKNRVERIKQAVNLDQKQIEAVTKIYTESIATMGAANTREDMMAANEDTNKKIETILTPEQKKKWAEYQAANPRGARPQN